MANASYQESENKLSIEACDMHRAIVSLMEELDAVDSYNQRAERCANPELRAILEHNRDEEKEHASMLIEWIRRRDPVLSGELKEVLFTDKKISD